MPFGTATYFDLTYDAAGNIRTRELTSTTISRDARDLWKRLVKVDHVTNPGGSETGVTKGQAELYGTHFRQETATCLHGYDRKQPPVSTRPACSCTVLDGSAMGA